MLEVEFITGFFLQGKKHKILFELETVIDMTLDMQLRDYRSDKGETDCTFQTTVLLMTVLTGSTKSLTETRGRVSDAEIQVNLINGPDLQKLPPGKATNILGPQRTKSKKSTKRIPWFAGCEYRCRICQELFFYVEDLRDHVKRVHCKVYEYLDKYENFETKAMYDKCRLCDQQIKRSFFSFRHHLEREHDTSLAAYGKQFQLTDYVVTVVEKLPVEKPKSTEPVIGKRPSEATEGQRKSKRANIDGSNKVDNMKEKQVVKGDWFSGGLYVCQVCNDSHDNLSALVKHAKHAHDLTVRDYKKKFKSLAVKEVQYECRLCGHSIKHSKRSIEVHLQGCHGIDLDTYEDAFINKTRQVVMDHGETEAEGDELEGNGGDGSGDGDRCNREDSTTKKKEQEVVEDECPKYSSFKVFISSGSKYECIICKTFVTNDSSLFWSHVEKQHQLNPFNYREEYGSSSINQVQLKCPSCLLLVNHEPTDLERHAESHGVDVQECFKAFYSRRMNSPLTKDMDLEAKIAFERWCNKCQYKCKLCQKDLKEVHTFTKHLLSHNTDKASYAKNFGSLYSRIIHHSCLICKENVLHVRKNLSMHMLSKHFITLLEYYKKFNLGRKSTKGITLKQRLNSASAWAEKYSYYCRICKIYFPFKGDMSLHLKSIHNLSVAKYVKTFKSSPSDKTHKCRICSTKVRHTLHDLNNHTYRMHKMTVAKYFEEYILNNVDASDSLLDGDDNNVERVVHAAKSDRNVNTGRKGNHHSGLSNNTDEMFESSPSMSAEVLEGPNDDRNWMDACTFQCKICKAKLSSVKMFRQHLEQHSLSVDSYFDHYGVPITSLIKFKCPLCSEVLMHDSEDIEVHLKQQHPTVTTDEYRTIHLGNSEGDVPTIISVQGNAREQFLGQEDPGQELDLEQEQHPGEEQDLGQEQRSGQEQDLGQEEGVGLEQDLGQEEGVGLEQDLGQEEGVGLEQQAEGMDVTLESHIAPQKAVYMFKWTQMLYICPICSKNTNSFQSTKAHMISHGMTMNGIQPSKRYHKCKICQKPVVFTLQSMRAHMNLRHENMSLQIYEKVFESELQSEFIELLASCEAPGQIGSASSQVRSQDHGATQWQDNLF